MPGTQPLFKKDLQKKGKEGGKSRTHGHGGSEDTVHLHFREAFMEEGHLGRAS